MNNFVYECPTKIIFGKDKELEVGKIIKNYSALTNLNKSKSKVTNLNKSQI